MALFQRAASAPSRQLQQDVDRRGDDTLSGAALVLLAPPAMACGCGGVAAESGHRTAVDTEIALLTGDGTTETVHLRLSMQPTWALLVPTPTPATVTLSDADIFDNLTVTTRPRPVEKFHLFGPAVLFDSGSRSGNKACA